MGNGKFAYEQLPEFKALGEQICERVYDAWKPPSIFYHHRNGGHVAALRKHLDNKFFSRFDISQFFNRVTKNKIIRALKTCGFSFAEANYAAAHSVVRTELGFHLPFGFTQSPALASLCLNRSQAGQFLRKLDKDILISVYVDDIILSHKSDAAKLQAASEKLMEVFELFGFPIAKEKTVISEAKITAFNIELKNQSLILTPERLTQFFSQVVENWQDDQALDGIHNYVLSVNKNQGAEIGKSIERARSRR